MRPLVLAISLIVTAVMPAPLPAEVDIHLSAGPPATKSGLDIPPEALPRIRADIRNRASEQIGTALVPVRKRR